MCTFLHPRFGLLLPALNAIYPSKVSLHCVMQLFQASANFLNITKSLRSTFSSGVFCRKKGGEVRCILQPADWHKLSCSVAVGIGQLIPYCFLRLEYLL